MPSYVIWICPCLSFLEIVEVLPDFLGELLHFPSKSGIALFEHIANPCKVVLVFDQHGIMLQLFFGQTFDDVIAKC